MKQSLPTLHDIIDNLDIYGIQTPKEERDMTISQFKLLLTAYLESQVSDNCTADEWQHILVTNTIEEYVDTLSNLKLMMLAAGISITIIPSPEDMNTTLKNLQKGHTMKQTFVVNYKAGLSEIFTMEAANAALGDATAINSNNTDVIEIHELLNFGLSNVISFGTITVQYNKYTIQYTDWNISVMFYDNDVELFNYCLELGIEECMECIPHYEILNSYN